MKSNMVSRMVACVMIVAIALLALSSCTQDVEDAVMDLGSIERLERENAELERTIVQLEATITQLEAAVADSQGDDAGSQGNDADSQGGIVISETNCDGDCTELELPGLWAEISGAHRFKQADVLQGQGSGIREHIRVFENGNANVRLFPDGTFVANLFHNTKITGTYSELTQGNETAVLFTYGGITNLAGGVSTFDATGPVTVVGGIFNDVLTIPDDWDDGHDHGMDFPYRAYPLVFAGENDQRVILFADNTFAANLDGDVIIIGFYGMRATSVTFVPGSPTFSSGGDPVGTFLFARLTTCSDHGDEHGPEPEPDPCEDHEHESCDDDDGHH